MLLEESGHWGTAADNMHKTKGWKTYRSHRWNGWAPCESAWPTCFPLYAYLRRSYSLGWLIDTKRPRLNMLQNKLGGIDVGVVLLSSSRSNLPRVSINRGFKQFSRSAVEEIWPKQTDRSLTFYLIHLNILGTSPLHKKCSGRLRMDHQFNLQNNQKQTHSCMHTHERKKPTAFSTSECVQNQVTTSFLCVLFLSFLHLPIYSSLLFTCGRQPMKY